MKAGRAKMRRREEGGGRAVSFNGGWVQVLCLAEGEIEEGSAVVSRGGGGGGGGWVDRGVGVKVEEGGGGRLGEGWAQAR